MIDIKEIQKALEDMKPRSVLYNLVKQEMQKRGRWKYKPRGKRFENGYDSRRRGL